MIDQKYVQSTLVIRPPQGTGKKVALYAYTFTLKSLVGKVGTRYWVALYPVVALYPRGLITRVDCYDYVNVIYIMGQENKFRLNQNWSGVNQGRTIPEKSGF